jgi:outer membrane protein assembly factor BamB
LAAVPSLQQLTASSNMTYKLSCPLLLALALGLPAAGGENWTSFRGPSNQGLTNGADLPLRWSEDENVRWKTPVPGKAWSSPVIWGDRIWLTNANPEGTSLMVYSVDKNNGRILLRKKLRLVVAPQYCHPFNSYASPSPVVEAGRLYVSFGSPYNGCLDLESGEVIWERKDFVCNHFRGAGSSPFIFKDLLIQHFDGSDLQYVVAMNKETGETVWKTDRSVDYQDRDPDTGEIYREGDQRKAYSTPVIVNVKGKPLLISLGSMALYAYDPMTGKEVWRVEAIDSHSGSCRPVLGHGLVYAPMGMDRELWAVRPDGQGNVTESHVVWKYTRDVPSRSSPILVDDLLFMVNDKGVAACVEAKTGKEVWRERLGGNYSASPIHARGRIYFCNEDGECSVVQASRTFRVLAVNQLDDGFMASPAVSENALFLRTRSHLYRVE